MLLYRCKICGYIYKKEVGDQANGIPPGTDFSALPDNWKCPICGVGKEEFEEISEADVQRPPAHQKGSPIGPLMAEHRLIERIIPVLSKELEEPDTKFVYEAVDFFRTYADRLHHGKEEDILFRGLEKKMLSEKDSALMKRLINDHLEARANIKALVVACEKYDQGEKDLQEEIKKRLEFLIKLYPEHIKAEDKEFFPAAMGYFSSDEAAEMTAEMESFDLRVIHDKYRQIMEAWEAR